MLMITGKDVGMIFSLFVIMELSYFILIILIARIAEKKSKKPKNNTP